MANRFPIPVAVALLILPCSTLVAAPPREALDSESRMEFIETPLTHIADFLSDQHSVKFVLGPTVEGSEPVSVNATGRLSDLLTKVLRPLGLEYRVERDSILITPTDEAVYVKLLRDKTEAERLNRDRHNRARETLRALGARLVEDGRGRVMEATLSGGSVSDSQIAPVRDLCWLTRLDLSGTAITDEGLAHLKGLDHLDILRLRGTKITDPGLRQLRTLARLRGLDISKTGITDDGLLTLAEIPTLESVLVADTCITVRGIAKLRERSPQVRVKIEAPKAARPQADGDSEPSPSNPFGGKRR